MSRNGRRTGPARRPAAQKKRTNVTSGKGSRLHFFLSTFQDGRRSFGRRTAPRLTSSERIRERRPRPRPRPRPREAALNCRVSTGKFNLCEVRSLLAKWTSLPRSRTLSPAHFSPLIVKWTRSPPASPLRPLRPTARPRGPTPMPSVLVAVPSSQPVSGSDAPRTVLPRRHFAEGE